MRANLTFSRVRLLAATLAVLLGCLLVHWMISSPIRAQEGGGEPAPNEESATPNNPGR